MIGDPRPADAVIGAGVFLSPGLAKLAVDWIDYGIEAARRSNAGGEVPPGTEMLRETLLAGSRLRARQGADVIAIRRPQVPASTAPNAEDVAGQAHSSAWSLLGEASKASGLSCGYLRRLARRGDIPGAIKSEDGWIFPPGTTIERRRPRG